MSAPASPVQAFAATGPGSPPAAGGWRVWPSWAIAWVTFLEFWRRWFLLGLLVIGLLPGILAAVMPIEVQRASARVELILLWGLGGIAFGGALGASLMASLQTPMEIEDRRIYGLVCRPVGRWRLMIGKMLGCMLFLAVYAAVGYAVMAGLAWQALAGTPDAGRFTITRSAQDAVMIGMSTQPKHTRSYDGQAPVRVPFDFTVSGPIGDWGRAPQERYRWVLLTCVRNQGGQPEVGREWNEDQPAFQCSVNGYPLPQWIQNQDEATPRADWCLEKSGHAVLIFPESLAARTLADRVQIQLDLKPGYFAAGDQFFLSDLALTDKPLPPFDDNLKQPIPFVQTIITVAEGQTADYLVARAPGESAPDEALFVGMMLKSAAIFRDLFAMEVSLERFTPGQAQFVAERRARWVVTERKMLWTPLIDPAGTADAGAGSEPRFGPVLAAPAGGWRVLRLKGLPAVLGKADSGALFQLRSQGDIQIAAARSNLWVNLLAAMGLFFIQWCCLVLIIVAWSGNLSLGVAVLCALILAVSCYGSGSARSVLTEEYRSLEHRERQARLHPELKLPPVAGWRFALNKVMYGIVWTPPDFMVFSPTDRIKTQTDIAFSEWCNAVLVLLVYRAAPVAGVGLLVFQKREF